MYDTVVTMDTSDTGGILLWCQGLPAESIHGITSSSEYFIESSARIAAALGLRHPSPIAVRSCRDKSATRQLLSDAGVAVPRWWLCTDVAAVKDAMAELGGPGVVKPVDGSGSVGVRLCDTADQAVLAAGELLSSGTNERGMPRAAGVLVEGYVDGPEFSVEVFNGAALTIVEKHLGLPPHFVETGHDIEAALDPEADRLVRHAAERAVAALGIGFGPVHVELRLDSGTPRIIEVNPRLAGGNIPRLIELASGVDVISLHIGQLAGAPSHPPQRRWRKGASIRFLHFPAAGRITRVPERAELDGLPAVAAECRVKAGDLYCPRGDFTDRIGHVITSGATSEEARRSADEALRRLAGTIQLEAL
ncbi:ATP-grasp domain-containing protein [Streptomyces sp. NPDC002779]|uniref:ATP-grasp domain-containing protein n=1 Tax=Streptomyces sp. NPDC002779 TaxID=3364664 RepID=UPI0036C8E448